MAASDGILSRGGCVLVIGDVMTDVIVAPEGPLLPGTDRRATIRTLPGGSGANQAAWLASLGVPTRFVGRVGASDQEFQSALLAGAGVTAHLAADADLPTGSVVTILSPGGERSFFTDRGANARLSRIDVPDALLDGASLLHVSGYALFETGPRAALLDLLSEAARREIPVTVDPGSESFLRDVGPDQFLAWTEGAAICFPNSAEAAALTGSTYVETQLETLCCHYSAVVIKTGASGAQARSSRGRWSAAATVSAATDTSGAGDAFLAGFLAAHLAGAGMQDCLQGAVATAARAVSRLGARPPGAAAGSFSQPP